MRTVIFDLDGTLADTSADLLAAANAAFGLAGHGAPLGPADALTAFHGGRAMLRLGAERLGLGWDEDEVGRHYPVLLDAYDAAIDTHTRLYPGALQAVEDLRADGIAVGICTNKPDHLAEKLLRRLGVRDLFGAMVGATTLAVRKPDPAPLFHAIAGVGGDPARAVLIGDTETDRRTGRAANIPVVLVTFGPEGEGVARLAPEALLHHYTDLRAVVAPLVDRS
ncbi:HAD-IA family hydrolase [Gemmobacter sp.]|uniref:HAD-IA family hydrolase n=1 Tax=Gemmobacter sp. TaxID=1898957 RepID=UPI002AFF1397|nr:HAD-IA family hydrolase [Gemmobacter sp.]